MIYPFRLALVSSLAMISSSHAFSLTMTPLAFTSTSRTTLSTTHSTNHRTLSRLFYQASMLEQDTMVNNYSVASSTSSAESKTAITTHINDSNYQSILQNSFNHPVLVDFYMTNCGPCKLIEQSLQSILPKYSSPNAEQQQLIACKWDANKKENSPQFLNLLRDAEMTFRKLPTLILFVDGLPVAKRSGMATSGQLDQFLEENLPPVDTFDDEMDECVPEVNLQGERSFCQE